MQWNSLPRSLRLVLFMGIRFTCPNGHKLHVKSFLAGKRGVCPQCGAKILIPLEEQAPEQAAQAQRLVESTGPIESASASADPFTNAGAPSVVIAIADSTVASPPVSETPVAASRIVPTMPPTVPLAPTAMPPVGPQLPAGDEPLGAQPLIVADAVEPVSPAVRYVAQRERHRRNQFMFAVMLLIAVILLAGVLVYILMRGAGQAPSRDNQATSVYDLPSSRHFAVFIDRSFNAHRALVAIS
jgi:hypothetical protein